MNKNALRAFVAVCGILIGSTTMVMATGSIVPIKPIVPITDEYACSGSNPAVDCCKSKYSSDRENCLVCCDHTFDPGRQSNNNTDCNNACPAH